MIDSGSLAEDLTMAEASSTNTQAAPSPYFNQKYTPVIEEDSGLDLGTGFSGAS